MASRFDKFSERARRVLTLAQDEAQRLNHNYIGTEHILLGLVKEEDGVAARVLVSMGLNLGKISQAVEYIIGPGDKSNINTTGLTTKAKRVLELAIDEARHLGTPI
jgi:ATP-dependent Clp protease ATP-binding subunit ClpC